jgi:hypothetical protein
VMSVPFLINVVVILGSIDALVVPALAVDN